MKLTWLGHGGFLFESPTGSKMVVNPYLSNSFEEQTGKIDNRNLLAAPANALFSKTGPQRISYEKMSPNAVIATNAQIFQCDPETLRNFCEKTAAVFMGPASVCEKFREIGIPEDRIEEFKRGDKKYVGDIRLTATPAYQNYTMQIRREGGGGPFYDDGIGMNIWIDGFGTYYVGDTIFRDELVVRNTMDLTIAGFRGGRDCLTPEEAVKVATGCESYCFIPAFYGAIKTMDGDPSVLEPLLKARNRRLEILEYDVTYPVSLGSDRWIAAPKPR